jgi:hypothetical protein
MTSLLQQILPAIPSEAAPTVAWVAAAGVAFGAALWLIGSRFSRQLVTLVAVAAGAALGLQVPRSLGLTIGSWATAVGGALALGVLGYVFHRVFIKLGLAILMAACGICAAWLLYASDTNWTLPTRGESTSLWDYALQFWNAVPPDLRMSAPLGAGIGLVIAGTLSFLLPRLAISLFYSLSGFCMMAGFGFLAASHFRPQLLDAIPQNHSVQLIAMAGVVVFGTLLQWWLHPRPARPAPAEPKNDENNPSAQKGDG